MINSGKLKLKEDIKDTKKKVEENTREAFTSKNS